MLPTTNLQSIRTTSTICVEVSLESARAVCGGYNAVSCDLAREIARNGNSEGRWGLGQQSAIEVIVGHPNQLSPSVVERREHMCSVNILATFVDELTG